MTHDELLTEINRRLEVALYNGDPQSIHALRAVVELHTPVIEKLDDPFIVKFCHKCKQIYPCETIEVIEKELG